MANFDYEKLPLLIESMKMNQATLKEITALSAGGLALYFSFIGRGSFIDSIRIIGILVVLSWITSLCMAVIGHLNQGKLYLCIFHLAGFVTDEKDFIKNTLEKIDKMELRLHGYENKPIENIKFEVEEMKSQIQQMKSEAKNVKTSCDLKYDAFDKNFFPLQNRTTKLISVSLYTFVSGFVMLAVAYIFWSVRA